MKRPVMLLLATGIAFLSVVIFATSARAGNTYQSTDIEHGKYIATIAGCTDCHTPLKPEYQDPTKLTIEQLKTIAFNGLAAADETKLLAGGRAFDLGPAGILLTRNLTPDQETGIAKWGDDQIKLAIKTGADVEGGTLFPVMPYHVYNTMADADLDAVIAYLRSVKAVKNEIPKRTVSTAGLPTLPYNTDIIAPDPSDKAARGAYLVNSVMGCTDCHTPVDPATGAPQMEKYLAGRQPYEGPWGIVYGGNITPDPETGIGNWTEEEIKRAILTGVNKEGRRLILMPWFAYSSLTSDDADAVAYYLKNVLPAVRNSIPAPSLNEGFDELAPEAQGQLPGSGIALSPAILVIVGIGIILLVSVVFALLRRRAA